MPRKETSRKPIHELRNVVIVSLTAHTDRDHHYWTPLIRDATLVQLVRMMQKYQLSDIDLSEYFFVSV